MHLHLALVNRFFCLLEAQFIIHLKQIIQTLCWGEKCEKQKPCR